MVPCLFGAEQAARNKINKQLSKVANRLQVRDFMFSVVVDFRLFYWSEGQALKSETANRTLELICIIKQLR